MTNAFYSRTLNEDALKHICGCERDGGVVTGDSLAGALSIRRGQAANLLGALSEHGWVETQDGQWILTAPGREYALHVVRAHRLYETYLAAQTGMPPTLWHAEAEKQEHVLSPGEVDDLARELGHPRFDPHGDPIPTREGQLPADTGTPLLGKNEGWVGRIDHVEDEPETVFLMLDAAGLYAGMRLRIEKATPSGIEVLIDGRRADLSPVMAANVHVRDLEDGESSDMHVSRLTDLGFHTDAEVVGLTAACRGGERRRLLDLGIVPGSSIRKELRGPFKSPSAFRIRGSLVALREKQTEQILIKQVGEVSE